MRWNKIKIKYIYMKNWDMVYITVEIQTSSVALRYLGVMIWDNHIRELWEYFRGCGKWPQIEHLWVDIEDAEKDPKSSVCTNVFSPWLRGIILYKTPLWYYRFLFMWLSRLDRYPFFCVFSAFNPGYSRGAEILWWENYKRRVNMLLCYVV